MTDQDREMEAAREAQEHSEQKAVDVETELLILEQGMNSDFWNYLLNKWKANSDHLMRSVVLKHLTTAVDPIMRDRICERLGGIQAVMDYPAERYRKLQSEKKAKFHNKEIANG